MSAKCPRCGSPTYVTIAFLRFYPDRFYPSVKAYAATFKTEKEQQDFTDALNRILTTEAPN
jgi:rRNA maturation protein Nop10